MSGEACRMKTEKEGDESRDTAWKSAENAENIYAF